MNDFLFFYKSYYIRKVSVQQEKSTFDVRFSDMKWCCRSGFSLLQWTYQINGGYQMKKGLIIQGIKTKTSVPVFVSTLFYVFLATFFIEGGLWLSSELVGPFSTAIGTLTEFFSPGNGVASIQEFFFHYILYYELFSFVFILILFIFWVTFIEKNP